MAQATLQLQQVKLALDWTPNTNHSGFYVAKQKGWYADAGLEVHFISPHTDDYKATPGSRVADGTATFAITPSETVISYHTFPVADARPKVKAVAALLQDSTSAIVTLGTSDLDRPAKLDGKKYASYGARFEGRIVQQMIKADGGKGEFVESTPPMLGIWNTLLKGEADATWVFLGWEGIEAKRKGVQLHSFSPEAYHVPYGYSPLLVTHTDTIANHHEMVTSFLAATAKGYQLAAAHPHEAAELFLEAVAAEHADAPLPQPLDAEMVKESQEYLASHLLDSHGRWGAMRAPVWDKFLDWLSENGLLTSKVQSREPIEGKSTSLDSLRAGDVGEAIPRDSIKASDMYTNDLLP